MFLERLKKFRIEILNSCMVIRRTKMKKLKRSMATLLASASVFATASFAQDPAQAAPAQTAPAQAPAPAAAPANPEPQPAAQAPAAVPNDPPQVSGIPGEYIQEGGAFTPIKLDNFVTDDTDQPSQIRWKVSGNKNLKVIIGADHTAIICFSASSLIRSMHF